MPSSSSDADTKRVPQPIRDGQRSPGSTANRVPDELADRPGWLLDKAREEDWGTAEWLRWERLRTRFVYLRVEPHYRDDGDACLSCSWLGDDALGLPTISSMLRTDDPFPVLDALTRLMTAVATDRRRQVRDSLGSTE
jgi:hypothetical protein